MRLKRFKADPDKYRAIRLAKANGGKSEDYLGQPTVDISGQSEESSELSLATESDWENQWAAMMVTNEQYEAKLGQEMFGPADMKPMHVPAWQY